MEGKRDEVLAAKAKARQLKKDKTAASNSSAASGICHDKSGRAYIIDSQTNQAILYLASDNGGSSHHGFRNSLWLRSLRFPTDPIPAKWYGNMSEADKFEY